MVCNLPCTNRSATRMIPRRIWERPQPVIAFEFVSWARSAPDLSHGAFQLGHSQVRTSLNCHSSGAAGPCASLQRFPSSFSICTTHQHPPRPTPMLAGRRKEPLCFNSRRSRFFHARNTPSDAATGRYWHLPRSWLTSLDLSPLGSGVLHRTIPFAALPRSLESKQRK